MSVPSASPFIIISAPHATSVPLYLKTWPKWLRVLPPRLYANTVLFGATQKNISKLQKAKNLLARVVTCSPQSCSPHTLLQQIHWLPIKHRIAFKIANITFRTLYSFLLNRLTYVHPCMPVIPLVPSDSPTLISSLLRLSAHHLALAASASRPLKSGTLSLYLSVPVPVLIPFVVTSRPTTASNTDAHQPRQSTECSTHSLKITE